MVIPYQAALSWLPVCAEAEAPRRVLERLDPQSRAFALLTLIALVLFACILVLAVAVGGHWVRRRARQRHGPTILPSKTPNSESTDALEQSYTESESIGTAETLMDFSNEDTRGKE